MTHRSDQRTTLRLLLTAIAAIVGTIGVNASALAEAVGIPSSPESLEADLDAVEPRVIAWRRDFHEHPELGNREFRTARIIATHLRRLGLEVRTGIAKTGVIGILRGAAPGPVLALRADMDALPVKEQTGLPFASKAIAEYGFAKVPVMHACGHDGHTAALMGAAEVLSRHRAKIRGTVVFLFQPAEEGPPPGEQGGAQLVLAEGALASPKPDAIFALHFEPGQPGRIEVRSGPLLSSATTLKIALSGKQTHAGRPWEGTDLINLSADVIKAVTTISARRVNVFAIPNVVSIAKIEAGVASNILPGEVRLEGTMRTFSADRLAELQRLIRAAVEPLAASYGARAQIEFEEVARVTRNDPALLDRIMPALKGAAGDAGVENAALMRGAAEDFSYYLDYIPGAYYIIGSSKNYSSTSPSAPNHSPFFDIDESVLRVAVRAHVLTALQFFDSKGPWVTELR
jgi:amidohydrolase